MNIPPTSHSKYDQTVVRYAEWLLRWRWLVVALSLFAVAAMTAGVRHLKFDTDYRVYFGPDNPQLKAFEEVQNVYNKSDSILVVFAPKSGNVFEPRTLEAIRSFTADAWKLPYTLRVDSITNFQHTEASGDDLTVRALLPNDEEITPERVARIKSIVLNEPLLLRRMISPTGHVTAVNINSQFPQTSPNELPETVTAARALRDRYLKEYPELSIYMAGSNMMSISFTEAAKKDMSTLVPAMYLAIFLIMWLMLRSGWATFGTLLVVFFASLSAMGLAGYIGIGLSPPVVQAPQIIMVLAVADSVHICLTMFALMREGLDKHKAIIESMRINFTPVFLVSATTSICFLSTNFTDSPPLTALGNISSIGGMLSWLFAISLLPALLAILPARVPKERKSRYLTPAMDRLGEFVLRNRWPVFISTLAVVLGLTALVPLNEANDKFAHYFDKSIQFRNDTDFVVDNLTGLYTMEFSLK
ncbi:MAG: efflux RND transporter permease subunit, partial [Nevskiales bacterium]